MARRDQQPQQSKQEVQFGGPRVAPGMPGVNPIAVRAQAAMAARGHGMQTYNAPVAGGPTPMIPRLDMQAEEGSTMADQAQQQRMPPMQPPGPAVTSFIQPGVANARAAPSMGQRQEPARAPALLPGDVLPQVAKEDSDYQEGMGSMYATSNPRLAYKYGVIRNGKHIPPQQLQAGGKGGLSAATIEGLKTVADFQNKRQNAEGENPAVEAAAAAGSAGQAARFGQKGDEKPLTLEDRARIQNSMDDFDFNTLREMLMKDILNNDAQKKIIEDRLDPMDLSDYVANGFVEQEVVINSKLRYTLRSVDAEVDLILKRLVVKEAKGFSADDRYILDKYAVMSMAVMLTRINGTQLPGYTDATGEFSDDAFWEKYKKVSRLGLHIIASVGINCFWFDIRVRKLVVAEALGNG